MTRIRVTQHVGLRVGPFSCSPPCYLSASKALNFNCRHTIPTPSSHARPPRSPSNSVGILGSGSTPPTAISNFTYASDFSSGGPVLLTSDQLSQQTVTSYFVAAANSQQVTFTLNYVDNQSHNQTASATATFNIAGPTSVTVSTTRGQWEIDTPTSGPILSFGFPIGTPGITFNGKATSPSGDTGTYEWAQLVTTNTKTKISGSTTTTCSTGTGLDNQFPTFTTLSFSDSPSTSLSSTYNQITWSLGFTTYFLWRPGLANDIPIPLGYVTWTAYGDAALSGSTWSAQSDSTSSANAFQASASYLSWTSKVTNGPNTCQ